MTRTNPIGAETLQVRTATTTDANANQSQPKSALAEIWRPVMAMDIQEARFPYSAR
jgi:hypothetical protein